MLLSEQGVMVDRKNFQQKFEAFLKTHTMKIGSGWMKDSDG